jgi:hypothetical protein
VIEMKKTLLAALIGSIILTIHYTLCALSALTIEKDTIAHRYTQPLFQQPWSALGSDLATNAMELEFRIKSKTKSWTDWKDATGGYSFEASSQAERIEQSILNELRWQLSHNLYSENGRTELKTITESIAYSKALYYVMRMERYNEQNRPDSIQIRTAIEFIPAMDAAPTRQLSYVTFPPYGAP